MTDPARVEALRLLREFIHKRESPWCKTEEVTRAEEAVLCPLAEGIRLEERKKK